ncbi:serine/threonine-protein phosphatase [Aliikangiella marina]|uniref:Serine/threonine-protein phosphatase n=1 Tax=Aliikangiella marina TaxID=1712262 RepID=A0A545TBI5_9GAMM|nr:protein phosphatase 2C domain-containing protein [Aliikangiella marina]TQV74566.1 serine/threonine-protein phosphatase [Aliikangiella marina]
MKYTIDLECSVGAFRQNNEDVISYGSDPRVGFFWMVVADGMGGHKAGEVAAGLLAESFENAVAELDGYYELSWPNWIERIFKEANENIWQAARDNKQYSGMGTTGVVLVQWAGKFHVGWVGDSRAYLWRDGEVKLLTRDHSAIHYLLDKGSITKEEAEESDSNHLLARAIGSKKTVEVDLLSDYLKSGDIMMLSTDGMHDFIPQITLRDYFAKFNSGKNIAASLVSIAIAQGSQDNITLGVVKSES